MQRPLPSPPGRVSSVTVLTSLTTAKRHGSGGSDRESCDSTSDSSDKHSQKPRSPDTIVNWHVSGIRSSSLEKKVLSRWSAASWWAPPFAPPVFSRHIS